MERKPDSDLYPPYSADYYRDMEAWKNQTGCDPENCDCQYLAKGTCKHEKGAIMDYCKKYPTVKF